ncbi:MAG: class I SAM-dependent methyltransferase, partial [Desulfuromonadaceae bacterium]
MSESTAVNCIRTEPKPDCMLCGQQGEVLYNGLRDRLFGVPGEWTLNKCPNAECGLVWLDPAPRKDELWKAYTTYYTHQDNLIPSSNVIKRVYRFVRDCYLSLKYCYFEGLIQSRFKWLGLLMYFFPGRRADVDFSVMYLPSKPHGRLLEIGCGSGSMLNYMVLLGWKAEGIDLDPSAVANAQGKGLKVALGSLEEQGHQDKTFDAIILSHVIEHVADPACLLAECYRILKPGGVLS